ncbi:MAG: nucleotidyltransferase family protein [Pseudomonadota bacterium]
MVEQPPTLTPKPKANANPLAAIVLAAGASRRFGAANKLLADAGGVPLIARVGRAVSEAGVFDDIVAVVRPNASDVRRAIESYVTRFVENADADTGLSTSVRLGVGALAQATRGVLIAQGDMPDLSADLVRRLVAAFDETPGTAIVAPSPRDRPDVIGTPVIWPRRYFDELLELQGDTGARAILKREHANIQTIPIDDLAELADIDTPDQLAAWRARRGL